MHSWRPSVSFCIITNGAKPDHLRRLIESIRALALPEFEILVAGKPPPNLDGITAIQLPDAADNGQLGAMRNACCRVASKEILAVADDDMRFEPDFYTGLCQFGGDFDVMCCRLLNTDGSRFFDWAVIGAPTGQHLLPYEATSPYVYVTGGLAILKPAVFAKVQWDELRGFYNQEDVDFSARLKAAGFRITFNRFSTVVHIDERYTQLDSLVVRADQSLHKAELLIPGAGFAEGCLKGEGNFLITRQALVYFDPLKSTAQMSFTATSDRPGSMHSAPGNDLLLAIESDHGSRAEVALPSSREPVPISAALAPGIDHVWFRIKPDSAQPVSSIPAQTGSVEIRNFAISGIAPNSLPIPPQCTDKGRLLIFSSLLDHGELSRAVRSALLQENVPPRVALKLLRSRSIIETNLSAKQKEIALAFGLETEFISRAAVIHDGSFTIGLNFYKAQDSRWRRALFIGPADAVEDRMLSEVQQGRMSLAAFSIEDVELLKSRGAPATQVALLPLIPRRFSTGIISRPLRNIFIPLTHPITMPMRLVCAQLQAILRALPETAAFLYLGDPETAANRQSEIQEFFEPLGLNSRVRIFGGVVPDAVWDEVLPQMDIALCLGNTDSFGFLVRELLAMQIPVAATVVGARRDIRTPALVPVEDAARFSETLIENVPQLERLRNECRRYAAELAAAPSFIDSVERIIPTDVSLVV